MIGWLLLRSAAFTPGESPRYSFYRRLSGSQDQSGHKEVKKNVQPSDTRDRTRAVQPVPQHLAAWATWPLNANMTQTCWTQCLKISLDTRHRPSYAADEDFGKFLKTSCHISVMELHIFLESGAMPFPYVASDTGIRISLREFVHLVFFIHHPFCLFFHPS